MSKTDFWVDRGTRMHRRAQAAEKYAVALEKQLNELQADIGKVADDRNWLRDRSRRQNEDIIKQWFEEVELKEKLKTTRALLACSLALNGAIVVAHFFFS